MQAIMIFIVHRDLQTEMNECNKNIAVEKNSLTENEVKPWREY